MANGYKDFVSEAVQRRAAAQQALLNDRSGTNLSSLVQGGINLATKRKANREFNKAITREEQGLYNKVSSYDEVADQLDIKTDEFFYGLISDYNEIKSHLENGTMLDTELGKRDLATIKSVVDIYAEALPKIISTGDEIIKSANI